MGRLDETIRKPVKIDEKDRKILSILSKEGRMPLSRIGKLVRLSRDSVAYRINRLKNNGVLLKVYPMIDFSRLGYSHFYVFLLIDNFGAETEQVIMGILKDNPHVRSVIGYTDRWDMELVILAKDVRDFDDIIRNILLKIPNTILEKDRLAVIRVYSSIHLPIHFAGPRRRIEPVDHPHDVHLDEIDYRIMEILSQDARRSSQEIAQALNIGPDTVIYRIKKLEVCGIIQKYTVMVNFSKLGYSVSAFALNLTHFDYETERRFREFVSNHPYVLKAVKALGDYDVLVYIAHDSQAALHKTLKELKSEFGAGIKNFWVWSCFKEYMYKTFPPAVNPYSQCYQKKQRFP